MSAMRHEVLLTSSLWHNIPTMSYSHHHATCSFSQWGPCDIRREWGGAHYIVHQHVLDPH